MQGRDVVEIRSGSDVITTFEHEDGERLLASMRAGVARLRHALVHARGRMPVIYVNDAHGHWDGDAPGQVARAVVGRGGDVIREVAPAGATASSSSLVFRVRRHSAQPCSGNWVTRVVLAGAATEMCVAQTGIGGRERGSR